MQIVTDAATMFIPLADMVDLEAERKRLTGELEHIEGEIARAEAKLSNQNFVSRAPAAVVDGERAKLEKYKEQRAGILEALKAVGA